MGDEMKIITLLSGGMDSAVALSWAKANHEVIGAISFWYGSKHNDAEFGHAEKLAAHYGISIQRVRLDFMASHFKSDLLKNGGEIPEGHYADPSMKRTVVPFRNGIMLSIAAGYAESIGGKGVVIGNHHGDHAIYPDCRAEFIDRMGWAIRYGTYAMIELISPFVCMTKTQIAKLGSELGTPFHLTYSCYKGGAIHCGKCGTCFERREAFREAGIPDPTEYEK